MRMKLMFALLAVTFAYAAPSFAICGGCVFDEIDPQGFCFQQQGTGFRCNNFEHPCAEQVDSHCDPKTIAAAPSLASRYQLASVEIRRSNETPRIAQTNVARVASLTK